MSDTFARLGTALEDRYRVERELGAGGMATVYLAHDLKHDRDVAIKVLHPDLGAALGGERFLSEIKTTARLQHPHILPLLDSGAADGLLYYVMPVVTGETLRARLDRERQLPISDAVRIAREVASALDYAHRQGVIHRDIKPENILLHDGSALVADFGIALAVQTAGGARMTQTGLSLGTPQYMSPEQAMGERTVDARSDVYALGAVTYEMLVGEPPFTGATVQAIVAKVLSAEAERPTLVRKTIPAAVEAAVLTALAKLPADRYASAAEFSQAMAGDGGAAGDATVTRGRNATAARGDARGVPRSVALVLAVVAIGGAATAGWLATRTAPAPVAAQFDVRLPDSVRLWSGSGTKISLSRDGSRLLFIGAQDGRRGLFVRRLDDAVARPVRGADVLIDFSSTVSPRFSPDGAWIVYSSGRALRKIAVDGGTPRTIVDDGANASWGDGDVILYMRGPGIWRVDADGRDARLVAAPDTAHGVFRLKWPEVLPGGTHALVVIDRARSGNLVDSLSLGVLTLSDGTVRDLEVKGTNPLWAGNGTIVFGAAGGAVQAVPFSGRSYRITGSPVKLLESVWQGSGGATGATVSWNGVLAFHGGGLRASERQLAIVDRSGRERIVATVQGLAIFPTVSPDGRRVAFGAGYAFEGGATLLELVTGARQRLAAPNEGARPVWTRDGSRVLMFRDRAGRTEIFSRAWDGSGADVTLASSATLLHELSPGPAHGYAVMRAVEQNNDLLIAPMDSLAAPRPLVATWANESSPAVSPSGAWLAYVSDESGQVEIYLRPIPGPGPRVQLSANGGAEPRWDARGRAVYYRGPSRMMVVELGGTPPVVVRRDSLFLDAYERPGNVNHQNWDLFANGTEFMMIRAREAELLTLVVNWQQWRAYTPAVRP